MTNGSYLSLLHNGEFKKRVAIFNDMLKNCVLCPHQCQVNRLQGERGYCKTLANPIVSGAEVHWGEEPELVGNHGSGTIFFSHCNLKCVFCQNYELSYCGEGQEVGNQELARLMIALQAKGCHNINLVSPSHLVPQIVEGIYIAAQQGLHIPIVYNTGGYDLIDTLKLLDGIIDIYMPDLKFADDSLAQKYLGVKQYATIARQALKEMFLQVGSLQVDQEGIAARGLLIRHLVMPGNLDQTEEILQFIYNEIHPDTYINLMGQYYPTHQAHRYPELTMGITKQEYRHVLDYAKKLGLTNVKAMG